MKLEMYINEEDLRKLLGSYLSKEENQKVSVIIKQNYEEILFEYRKFEKIKNTSVIVSVTLDLEEVKNILSNIIDKYEVLNIRECSDNDEIVGFYIDIEEKHQNVIMLKDR